MKHTYLKHFFISSLIVPMLNFANTTEVSFDGKNTSDAHAVVGSRPAVKEESQEASSQFFGGSYPAIYYPAGVHHVSAVSALGDSVEIEDGSVWQICRYDAPKVMSWLADHPVVITQNHRWFSKYNYRIINQATGESLEANLYLGPFENGPFTRYVISIDPCHGCVILSDGSHWKVSSFDSCNFEEWRLRDAVIVGYNSGYDSAYQGLLINVNMNSSVRAEQF